MPLRDHFRPPTAKVASWEAVHGGWPMVIVQSLSRKLPPRYVAHPRVQFGRPCEMPAQDEYEVRVYDAERAQRLVAAIELVSPANKDRPEHRRVFVGKCAALLQNQVSVTIVDLITVRAHNLYEELLELIGKSDPALSPLAPQIYAVACRATKREPKPGEGWQLEACCSRSRSACRSQRCRSGLPTTCPWLSISKKVTRKPAACCEFHEGRRFSAICVIWCYDSEKKAITIFAITPHP